MAQAAEQKPYVGDMKTMVTKYEDTLPEIARKNDIGFNELRSANPYVDPWMPGAGVKMTIPTRHILPESVHKGIVINLPEMRLYVYGANGMLLQSHPIGVGREGLSTPVGHTTIVRKVVGPIWRPTDRMRKEHPELPVEIGPGPDNPMGTHALYLGWAQYAIHGTDKPYAIGRRASSGCIRMYPEDIVQVYPAVPLGASVTVVNQPVKLAWIDGKLYLEAHPPLDQAMMIEEQGGRPYYDLTDDDMATIMRVAGEHADLIDWAKVRASIRDREGYPVAIADLGTAASVADDSDADTDDSNVPKQAAVDPDAAYIPPPLSPKPVIAVKAGPPVPPSVPKKDPVKAAAKPDAKKSAKTAKSDPDEVPPKAKKPAMPEEKRDYNS